MHGGREWTDGAYCVNQHGHMVLGKSPMTNDQGWMMKHGYDHEDDEWFRGSDQ